MKPSTLNLFLAVLAAIPLATGNTRAQTTNPPVYHGYLKVDQIDAGNNSTTTATPSVATQIVRKAGPGTVGAADRGDFNVNFGYQNNFANGVLLSSVRENGRNNGNAGDPNLMVYSTSSTWPAINGDATLSGHSIANLAGTLYSEYDGGTGPSFDGGVTGSSFVHTARPVAGFRPNVAAPALGQSFSANIVSLVKDWASGTANNGMVIQTQRVGTANAQSADGWQITTSSHATIAYRPKLTVQYLPPTAGATLHEFQNGLNGYASTVDALVNTPLPGGTVPEATEDGATIQSKFIDADDSLGRSQQGLFRFDNIVGAGKIDPNSTVVKAYLVMATNSSANSQTGGPVTVKKVLKPWTPTSLASSFSANGITEADGVVSPALDAVSNVGAYSEAWLDVTSAVQSWVNGQANYGLNVTSTTDGWATFFTGAPLPAVRPRLVVVTVPNGQTATPAIASFQNGVSGYTGTVDRAVSSTASENRDGSAINQYFLDGWNGTDSPQQSGLLRFDGLIGETSVPAGSIILKADLVLTCGNSGNAQSGGIFNIARLLEGFETQSGSTYSSEWNVDLSYAFFPYSEGWVGGLATNQAFLPTGELVDFLVDSNGNYLLDAQGQKISCNNQPLVTMIGSPDLLIGDETSWEADFLDYSQTVIPTGNGYYQLFLDGVDATTDGILLVGGGKNEGNYALSKPVTSEFGSAWEIVSHDNRVNGSAGENDPVAFVYIPLTAVADGKVKAMGRIMGDGSAPVQGGSFEVTNVAVGRWLLKIQGGSDTKGTLIISPEGRGERVTLDEFGNEIPQALVNVDNVVNYQWDEELGGWIVESRDLPSAGLQNVEADEGFFNFAYFEYPASGTDPRYQAWADANELGESESSPLLDPDGDGLQNFAEYALGTHPKKVDGTRATQVQMSGEGAARQLGITFSRLTDTGAKYNYVVEYSTDLKTWTPSETATEAIGTPLAAGYEQVTVKDAVAAGQASRFVRVRLVYTP